jgi:hypothetical protein
LSAADRGGRSAGSTGSTGSAGSTGSTGSAGSAGAGGQESDGGERPEALRITFDATHEMFATDNNGGFSYPLRTNGESYLDLGEFDECRLIFSVWHPSEQRSIDLDRAYVELRGSFDADADAEDVRWTRIAEIEPVVPPYGSDSFDGWIVLPVLAPVTAFALFGAGFEARSRIQVRGSAYFVP